MTFKLNRFILIIHYERRKLILDNTIIMAIFLI